MSKILKELSIGYIGYGNMAIKRLKTIVSLKNYKTNTLYVVDKKIKENHLKNHYKSWEKIKKIKTDLIIISIQTNEVKKIPFSILKNTKCLLIEKPVSTNITYFKKLRTFCFQNKITLKTGYKLRFDKGLNKAKNLLDKKLIGKLYYIKINYSNGTSKTNNNEIGSLLYIGCHSVNLLQWLLKTNTFSNYLKVIQKNEYENKTKDDNGFILMKLGRTAIQMQFGFCSWKNTFELELVGSKGYIKVDGLPKWGEQIISLGRRKYPSGVPNIKTWKYNREYSFKNEMKFLLENIISGKFSKKINDEGFETLKCLKKIA